MPIYNLPAENGVNFSSGLDQLFIYFESSIVSYVPLLLTSFFLIIWFGGLIRSKEDTGAEKAAQWFAIAGFTTFTLSVAMTLVDGLVSGFTLGITFTVMIIGVIWYLGTKS